MTRSPRRHGPSREEAAKGASGLPRRAAVVVLTDGIDTKSRLTAPEVSGIASSIDVPVYVVAVMSSDRRSRAPGAGQPGSDDQLAAPGLVAVDGRRVVHGQRPCPREHGGTADRRRAAQPVLAGIRSICQTGMEAAGNPGEATQPRGSSAQRLFGWRRTNVAGTRARAGLIVGSRPCWPQHMSAVSGREKPVP